MRKYSSNLHSLIRHPGECCAWFLALIMEPVNQLEKCQGKQREGSEISQETSSNLTEEDGPSPEMKINCGTPCPSCCGWKTRLHKFTRQKVHEGFAQYKRHTHCIGWEECPGRVTVYLFGFYAFQVSVLDHCWKWDLRPNRLWFDPGSLLCILESIWGDMGGTGVKYQEKCATHLLCTIRYIKSSFREKRVRA